MRQGDHEKRRLSKGPGRLRLLRLPPGQAALLQFAEHVTLASETVWNLRQVDQRREGVDA